jgi:hypothetical protein
VRKDDLVVVGLCGLPGTGKTATAESIVPNSTIRNWEGFTVDHLYFALPLYEMLNIRRGIEGDKRADRMRYEIHKVLLDVFTESPLYGAPPYHKLVAMVEEIVNLPVPLSGKARTFLQKAGTEVCRAYDPDCWIKWMNRTITERVRTVHTVSHLDAEGEEYERTSKAMFILSDCRFENEMELVKGYENGFLIRLDASEEERIARQEKRDGHSIDPQQLAHASEEAIQKLPDEYFDAILDTNGMTLEEQKYAVEDLIAKRFHFAPQLTLGVN